LSLLLIWQRATGVAFDPATGSLRYGIVEEPVSASSWLDETVQSWAIRPPASFDPAAGFPFNTPDEAYQSQCFPDPTTDIANAFGPPLNAVSAQAFNVPDEGAYQTTVDETAPALTLGIPAELTTPFNKPDEAGPQSNLDDTSPAWAVGPPLNATQAQAFNVPDEGAAQAKLDETSQSYAIQPPAVAAFDPAAGFPWNQDEGERFVQSQIVDDAINWALGQPPLNAVSAQAFNLPDEGGYQTAQPTVIDDTSQSYAIQPPAAAAFDPAGGFPWPVDDVVVSWPTYIDDAAQSWSVNPPALVPWNTADEGTYQPTGDETVQPWAVAPPTSTFVPGSGFPWNQTEAERPFPAWTIDADAIYGNSWAAPLGFITVVVGGFPPIAIARASISRAVARLHLPGGRGTAATPGGAATNPKPDGSATNQKPDGR